MKKLGVVIIISLFLIGFAMAGITTKAVVNDDEKGNQIKTTTENEGEETDLEIQNRVREKAEDLTEEQIKEIFSAKNKVMSNTNKTCPEKCICTGSTTKCQLNGTREMTILAGNSGNIIIQVKGINATTNVTLYKTEEGKVYAVTQENETKQINMLPNQVRERIRERLQKQIENETIELNENGTYEYSGEKNATLFFIFKVKEKIKAEINSETGEVKNIETPWWSFMVNEDEEQIVGASCGTVTPGYNDECCQNKEYDFWNSTVSECQFELNTK